MFDQHGEGSQLSGLGYDAGVIRSLGRGGPVPCEILLFLTHFATDICVY